MWSRERMGWGINRTVGRAEDGRSLRAVSCSSRSVRGCWTLQSPQGETTNRKSAVFPFHPLCTPGCPEPGPSSRNGEGRKRRQKLTAKGEGGAPLRSPVGEETCLARGTGRSRASACTRLQPCGLPGPQCQYSQPFLSAGSTPMDSTNNRV